MRNLYLTENRLSRNEMGYVGDNHYHMSHTFAKEYLYRFKLRLSMTKYRSFKELPQISHIKKNRNF